MSGRQILGAAMMASLFGCIFVSHAIEHGVWQAVLMALFVIAATAFVVVAAHLLTE